MRLRAVSFCIAVLVFLNGCDDISEKQLQELKETLPLSDFAVENNEHVKVYTEHSTYKRGTTEIQLTIENTSDMYAVIGADANVGDSSTEFFVEILLDGEWYFIGPDSAFTGLGASIGRGEVYTRSVDLTMVDFDWIEGHYRILVGVSVVTRRYYAAEFDIV